MARIHQTVVIICGTGCSWFPISILHQVQAATWGESTGAVCSAPGAYDKRCASTSLNLDKSLDNCRRRSKLCGTRIGRDPLSGSDGRGESGASFPPRNSLFYEPSSRACYATIPAPRLNCPGFCPGLGLRSRSEHTMLVVWSRLLQCPTSRYGLLIFEAGTKAG